jgi:basic amino acid/polyamine antiporter, APA family
MSTSTPKEPTGSGGIAGTGGIGGVAGGSATGERVFVRKASGLIKTASNTDVFIFDIGLVSVGLGMAFLFYFGAAAYPGANLYISVLLAGIAMIFIGGGMVCWTVTIPRSGGIYVFGSRSMWPPFAFTLSFCESSAWVFYSAFGAYYIVQIGLAPLVTTVGIIANSQGTIDWGTRLSTNYWTFGIAGGLELVGIAVLISGMRRFFQWQKVAFIGAIIGTFILYGTLIATSRHSFQTNFDKLMAKQLAVGNHPYQGILNAAAKAGLNLHPHMSWIHTITFANWAFLPLIGAAFSISIGGEIKQVTKGQRNGILGGVTMSVVAWIVAIPLMYHTVGKTFLSAVTYANFNGVKGASTPVTPYMTMLSGIGSASITLTILIAIGFMMWNWLWVPSQVGYGNRAVFAWALDRVFPDYLSKVNNRTHTPVPAIVFSGVAAIAMLWALVFTTVFRLAAFTEIAVFAWACVLLAGVFFPYRHKDMYEKGPLANIKFLGYPLMSVVCFFGAISGFLFFADMFGDNLAAGHGTTNLIILGSWFVGGFVIYWLCFLWRRSQGINVNLAFKQIPIE